MNQNPERPKNMNEILSQALNPKEKEFEKHKRIQEKIIMEVFGE